MITNESKFIPVNGIELDVFSLFDNLRFAKLKLWQMLHTLNLNQKLKNLNS